MSGVWHSVTSAPEGASTEKQSFLRRILLEFCQIRLALMIPPFTLSRSNYGNAFRLRASVVPPPKSKGTKKIKLYSHSLLTQVFVQLNLASSLQRSLFEMSEPPENEQRPQADHSLHRRPSRRHRLTKRSPPNTMTSLPSGSESASDSPSHVHFSRRSRAREIPAYARRTASRSRRIFSRGNAETIDLTNESDSPVPRPRPSNLPQRTSQPRNSSPEVIELDSEPDHSRQDRLRRRLLHHGGSSSTGGIPFDNNDGDLEVVGERRIQDRRLPTPIHTRPEDPINPPPPDPFFRRLPPAASSSRSRDAPSHRGFFEGALQNVFGFMGYGGRMGPSTGGPVMSMNTVPQASGSLRGDIRRGLPGSIGATMGFFSAQPSLPREPPLNGTNIPWPLDYETQGFQMGVHRYQSPPASEPPDYNPPAKARGGYTRKIQEEEILVCPRCGDELGVGDDPFKSQVWASKCGHVYCGECARQRIIGAGRKGPKKERPKGWKACVVDGCKQQLGTEKAMLQIYL
ncbi:MAG: hypothetical protein Q9160_002351 [Pyrenula sp. 1 TL-2023]